MINYNKKATKHLPNTYLHDQQSHQHIILKHSRVKSDSDPQDSATDLNICDLLIDFLE